MGHFTFTETEIKGVYIIEPKAFGDYRVYFTETYNYEDFNKAGLNMVFDVAVDLSKDSTTYGKWKGIRVSVKNKKSFTCKKALLMDL
jgi:dTDP-4-dehydrorhamnose 3,5-epimerase